MLTCGQITHPLAWHWQGYRRLYKGCPTWIRLLPTLPVEPLINHYIPQGPWQKISADIMDWDNKMYLLIVDYFSKYAFIFQMSSSTVTAIINSLTEPFALEGMSKEIFTDIGQHFSLKELWIFIDKYGFKYNASSTHYPQSNDFIERHVHTMKSTLNKATASRVPMSLSIHETVTPIVPTLQSCTESLHNWPTGPHVPGLQDLIPTDLHKIQEELISSNKRKLMTTEKCKGPFWPAYGPRDLIYHNPKWLGSLEKSLR